MILDVLVVARCVTMAKQYRLQETKKLRKEHHALANAERIFYNMNVEKARSREIEMIMVDQTKPHLYPHLYPTPRVSHHYKQHKQKKSKKIRVYQTQRKKVTRTKLNHTTQSSQPNQPIASN